MSSNFLDTSGLMTGGDVHTGFGAPMPYGVGSTHFLVSRFWRIAGSVKTDNWKVLQSNWAMLTVLHIPPVLVTPELPVIVITSSSAPQLSAHSVTAQGQAMLTAIVGAFGLNLDCGTVPTPTGIDLNINSVVTTPSPGDYAAAIVSASLSALYGTMTSAFTGGLGGFGDGASIMITIFQTLADMLNVPSSELSFLLDPPQWFINQVSSWVQSLVDG
jgi:hypothetical protein